MDENRLHRGEIEKLLVQSLYSDYTRLYRFSGMDQKKFLELYLKRYEMNLINYCLRIVFNHYQKPFDLDHKKIFFDKYSDPAVPLSADHSSALTERYSHFVAHLLLLLCHWFSAFFPRPAS